MQTYQGYIEDGLVVPIGMPDNLNGRKVTITMTDLVEKLPAAESSPKEGTIEYLFRDYDGTSFQTELVDLGSPVGNEKW
jgi:hypothetical protein